MTRERSFLTSLRLPALLVSLAVATVAAPPAWAGAPTEQLRAQVERVLTVLQDPELKKEDKARERRATLRSIANDIFDFTETARRALGQHWAARTPAEREEFVQLFADLLERAYMSKVETYGGEKVQYTGDTVDGDQATVKSKIVTPNGTVVPIEYRMLRKGDRWLVYDVVIEGVSLVANYRTQFNRIIQTSSFEELVKKMKSRQEGLGA
jgi:phospholipid transport system substrate-binding protein